MTSFDTEIGMRLDKWLWAARFYKTRALAQKQIELGRVLVNGNRVKNSKSVQIGDEITISLNHLPYKLIVQALNHQRRPAAEARQLYQEDERIASEREQLLALRKAEHISGIQTDARPTKKARRELDRFKSSW